ncbi:hypothetical protein JCM16816_07710 [Thermoanaerobacter brockii subsp. lactiethylicus]|jgi:predicted site-specific integrase-resolvase|uniref:Uncharacterized protein n=1 Tax=Thermoanaerobacter pseudethanolicus (strain ATCC 33223 / 39E) TaxID=340099 RepID=B0KB90_THEP3|nr:hypothetical protein Teth39_1636 [Thermoanaerobacter pseudethanolicus ATCC 33223]MBZ4656738.1 hypothetical protein [Thermoanaerobacter sp.]
MSEVGDEKLDAQEIFEEIVNFIHYYNMKLYSKRKIKKIKEILENGRWKR